MHTYLRAHRAYRANRICQCCVMCTTTRKDELHIFEGAAYAGLRAQFNDAISIVPITDVASSMRNTMNPVDQRSGQRLAEFLIMAMAVRKRTLAECFDSLLLYLYLISSYGVESPPISNE